MSLKKIRYSLSKKATGRNVIVFFILTQIIYFLMLFHTIPNLMNYANGMKILDLQPLGYSAEYAKALFNNLGANGRDYYLLRQIPLDMIYPVLFAISYSLLLILLFKKSFNKESKIHSLSVIPLFAGLFDYLENIGIIIMLSVYPSFSDFLTNVTNIFSVLKSISTTVFFVLLVIGIIGLLLNKVRKS